MLKVLDLFSGIGGFSLGLERTGGFETVAFCEIEKFPQKVLAKHWPDVFIYDDVRKINEDLMEGESIDCQVVVGGFPCQPFSTAAHGNNPKDYLSMEMIRVIKLATPDYVIAENTEKKAFSEDFIRALRDEGYEVYPKCISAGDIGADHERSRWWLCAYPDNKSELPGLIDAETRRMQEICKSVWNWKNYTGAIRVPDGLPNRMDRLKGLGNAVVPQIPELIGRAILEEIKAKDS